MACEPTNYYELKKLLDDFVWMRMLMAAGVPSDMLGVGVLSSLALAKEQEVWSMAKLEAVASLIHPGDQAMTLRVGNKVLADP